jgi:hypothetical protein
MITAKQRHQLEVADRTRDLDVIGIIVDDMLVEHPEVTPLDIETALRDAAARTYLVVKDGEVNVVLGMQDWLNALEQNGMTPDENRAALAALSKGE